jgi:hypothetical protein
MPAGRPRKIESYDEHVENPVVVNTVDENILALQNKLNELNIEFNESDDFMTLVDLLSTANKKPDVDKLQTYANRTNLKNKELIERLYKLGVSAFYISPIINPKKPDGTPVNLFTDNDNVLSDAELLEKVRFCGFEPVDFTRVMASYAVQPRPQRMR